MIALSKVVSSAIQAGLRLITALVTSKTDARECYDVAPYGWVSSPIAKTTAVYMDTANRMDNVIVGYIVKAAKPVNEGESMMYSTDTSGALKYYVYATATNITIGTGTPVNHFTQWEGLNTALATYLAGLDAAITAGIAGAGGAYVPPAPLNITGAKTTNVLTN